MPSTYAHYRFGKLLLPTLPQEVQQCVGRFRRMYDMGLQGPDFFFYHNPFLHTSAGELGKKFHAMSGKEFFLIACKAAGTEAGRAYLYGLLAHYALDSASHPFIHQKEEAGECVHVPLEKEFDRYLMAMDGIPEPHTYPIGDKLHLTRGECVTVSAFFPGSTAGEVNQSVKFMGFALNFLANHKKGMIVGALKKLYPGLLDHGIPEEADKSAERMCSELLARFNRCLKAYPAMLEQVEACRKSGEGVGEEFEPSFG